MELRRKIHFIGVGGISMSGIASIYLDLGYEVSGSDLRDSPLLRELERKGAKIFIGHDRDNLDNPDEVVVTTAIPSNNVELIKAHELGIPIFKRAQMIARLMDYKKGIAIAGTHGKTTTTSMISTLLENAGFDSTVLIGGELNDIGGNAKLGNGEYLVTEADESDGSFLFFEPHIAVVTNIEPDHMDFYGTEEKLKETFKKFLAKIPSDGAKIVCWDDPVIRDLINPDDENLFTYGMRDDCLLQIKEVNFMSKHTVVKIKYNSENSLEFNLQVPGMHNVYNSLAAICVGIYLGIPFEKIAGYISSFAGVQRRFENKGYINGILVIDDYGHHPTEIKATLKAARQRSEGRIICVFQPHRYSRTLNLLSEFSRSFSEADIIILTGIYSAGEKPIAGINGEKLAVLTENHEKRPIKYFPTLDGIAEHLTSLLQPGDLVLTMGAGDIYKVGEELVGMLNHSDLSINLS